MTAIAPNRKLDFESLYNFRDLGGYATADGRRTRWGVVYRADGVHRATPGDVARLGQLGIMRVIDLRTAHERTEDGTFDPRHPSIGYRHNPIFDDLTGDNRPDREADDYLVGLYFAMVEQRAQRLVEAVRAIATAPGPVVFHCTAGKDRTGVVAALVLAALGVDDATIAHDYALSHEAMDALMSWYRANRGAGIGTNAIAAPGSTTAAAVRVLGARPEWMRALLAAIRERHGSAAAYLVDSGLDEAALVTLEAKLLG